MSLDDGKQQGSQDILRQLHEASWRGIQFPLTDTREFGFQQSQEEHRFLFRDEKLVESLGRENPTYRYTIPFREDIVRGPWRNLFTAVYPQFLAACLDRSNGLLDDPFHGPVQCKVVSLQETADVGKKDGIDVQVTWIASPDDDFDRQDLGTLISTLQGARHTKDYLDSQATKLDDDTKKKLAAFNKGSEFGRLNPLAAATSALNQVEAAGNKVQAAFGDVAFQAEKLDDSLRRVANPSLAPTRSAARRLALVAGDLARSPFGARKRDTKTVRTYVVPADIGKLALSAKLGTNPQELVTLNPAIARSITVTKGTTVLYFR